MTNKWLVVCFAALALSSNSAIGAEPELPNADAPPNVIVVTETPVTPEPGSAAGFFAAPLSSTSQLDNVLTPSSLVGALIGLAAASTTTTTTTTSTTGTH